MSAKLVRHIPVALTAVRALLAPVVVLLSYYEPRPVWFSVCLIVALLSDIFDGVLARRLGVATANIRRLDSAADTLFYVACVFAAWRLHPSALSDRWLPLVLLGVLELVRYAVDFLKFRREASYHMLSSKLWGVALFIGFYSLLVFNSDGVWVSLAIYVGIFADLEGLAISLVLRHWKADVPTIFHALRER